jgi:hypothetical protein
MKREVISKPGAAIRVERIEMPQYIQDAIAENLRLGREVAERERAAQGTPWFRSIWNLFFKS